MMTTFKRGSRLAKTTLIAMAASPAMAADLTDPTPQPATAYATTATDWTGLYGGFTIGAVGGDGQADRSHGSGELILLDISNGLFPDSITKSETSVIGGVSLGYNLQQGNFVSGIEFDLSSANYVSEPMFSRVDPGPILPGVITNTAYRTETSNLATLRLRGGYTHGDMLIYATAGLAAGRVQNEFTLNLPNLPFVADGYTSSDWREDETRYGYVVGAGVERRLTDRVSIKGEALYYDLSDATVEGRDPVVFEGQELDYTFTNDGYVLRIGINVSF